MQPALALFLAVLPVGATARSSTGATSGGRLRTRAAATPDDVAATPDDGSRRLEGVAMHLAHAARIEQDRSAARGPAAAAVGQCGALKDFPNAKAKNYKDSRKTMYDKKLKKEVPVTFKAGDKVEFECVTGFTTTGAKDGEVGFEVACTEHGYYKPSKVCVKVNPCGDIPVIKNAGATGKVDGNKFQFACDEGYSLDGQKVVAGGFGKNKFFELECEEFSARYSKFEGECKPYSFVPTSEVIRVYNKVFQELFIVSCKGTLKKEFGKGGDLAHLDAACGKFEDSKGDCNSLVSKIKSDFETKQKALKEHREKSKKEWYEEDKKKPGIADEAKSFCEKLWKLVELPSL